MKPRVRTNWVRTAEFLKEGKNVMVKTVTRNNGSTVDILTFDGDSDNNFTYLGSADNDIPEPELDTTDIDDDIETNKVNSEVLVETFNEAKDQGRWYLDDDDDASGILMKYYDEMIGNITYQYLNMLKKSDRTSNYGFMKGLARTAGLKYSKEANEAFTSKLNIPFKDVKRLFDLPYKMNSWKDLKVNKQMNKNEKGLVKFLRDLHSGNSQALVNAIKDIKHNRPLPQGVSELDVKKLSIIMLSKYKKRKY